LLSLKIHPVAEISVDSKSQRAKICRNLTKSNRPRSHHSQTAVAVAAHGAASLAAEHIIHGRLSSAVGPRLTPIISF
jgi:hypothetical protein